MTATSAADLAAVLGFLEDAQAEEGPAPFTQTLVDRLVDVVGCEFGRYEEMDVAQRIEIAYTPCSAEVDAEGVSDEMDDDGWNEFLSDPCYRASYSCGTAVFIASEEVARSGIDEAASDWGDEFDRWGITDRMWISVEGPRWGGFAFDRCKRTFDERDRRLAWLLRPHLGELWRRAKARRHLQAALAALERDDGQGVLFISSNHVIEFASPPAERLLQRYFGTTSEHLSDEIAGWFEDAREPHFDIPSDDRALRIEALADGSTLLLRESPSCLELLTSREREVMRCVADGLSNTEIAGRLWIERATVRKHLEHVYDKLGVRSRTAALAKLSADRT